MTDNTQRTPLDDALDAPAPLSLVILTRIVFVGTLIAALAAALPVAERVL